jgi:DNA-binding transcriptional MerR regulator
MQTVDIYLYEANIGMSRNSKAGIALRSTVFSPKEMKEVAALCEKVKQPQYIFVPDVSSSLDAIELSVGILESSKTLKAGPGVIRLLEHDITNLARRIVMIQKMTMRRFFLGVGVGRPGSDAREAIKELFRRLKSLEEYSKEEKPEVFVAALKQGLAKKGAKNGYIPLLNFCSSEYAGEVVKEIGKVAKVDVACYIKVFYSEQQERAEANLIKEFVTYNMIPQYHDLFRMQLVDRDIEAAKEMNELPSSLLRICLANPSSKQLMQFVKEMRDAGVSIPVIYPYFDQKDKVQFRTSIIKDILSSLS